MATTIVRNIYPRRPAAAAKVFRHDAVVALISSTNAATQSSIVVAFLTVGVGLSALMGDTSMLDSLGNG